MATLMGWIRMILSQGGFLLILPFGNCVYGNFHLLSGVMIDQIYMLDCNLDLQVRVQSQPWCQPQ